MTKYAYTMKGTAADDQTWETSGAVEVAPGDFLDVTTLAMKDTFMKLTQGNAVFGQPGVGCKGPYSIAELTLKNSAGVAPVRDELAILRSSLSRVAEVAQQRGALITIPDQGNERGWNRMCADLMDFITRET